MSGLLKLYDRMVLALAVVAGASIAFMTLAIVADVLLRNLGFHPFQWTSAVVEYLLLFIAMAAGPWLVRIGGHVAIDSFVKALPAVLSGPVSRAVTVVTVFVLAWLAWRSAAVGFHEYGIASTDIRSIDIPGWIAYAMLAAGFALMALETLRAALPRGGENDS